MDKETEAAPSTSTPQDKKPATASSDKKSFGRNVGKLVSGTVIAQIVGFCAYPIITRLFNPEIYGVYTLILSIVSVLASVGCLRYEIAIVLPKEDRDASSLIFIALFVLLTICMITSIIILFFGDTIAYVVNAPSINNYLWVVPVILFISCTYTTLRYWNTRKKRFGIQATTQVTQTIMVAGTQTGLGFAGHLVPGSLFFGKIMGELSGAILLAISIFKKDLRTIISGFSISNIKKQIVEYRKFPLVDSWSKLINELSWNLPAILLTAFFSPTIAGLYALGVMVLQVPIGLIGSSLGQVFLQQGAIAHISGRLNHLLEDITELLLVLCIVPLIFLLTTGGELFGFIFGSDWSEAGVYCQILAVWAFVWFLSTSISPSVFSIIQKQELMMRFSILNLIGRFAALVIGGWIFNNVYVSLWLFTLSGIITYSYFIYMSFRETHASFKSVISRVKVPIILAIMLIGVTLVLNYILSIQVIGIILFAIVVCIAYYLYLYKSNKTFSEYFPLKLWKSHK